MSYLDRLDAIPPERAAERSALAGRWIRTEWRPFFAELRERRPILQTPAFTMVTRYPDVIEVLAHEEVFTVKLYQSKMDPVVGGPFMLARDNTVVNWREKGIMQAMLQREDLPAVRAMAGKLADEALDRNAAQGTIEAVGELGRYVPVRLCGDYFGFPGPDLPTMYRWSRAMQSDMFKNLLPHDPAVHEASVKVGQEVMDYLRVLLPKKRRQMARKGQTRGAPRRRSRPEDIFARLVGTRFSSGILFDDHRLLSNVAGLLIGSVETVSQAVVQVIEQLLSRPEVFEQALAAARADDVERFDRFVWEALRFNPINVLVFRLCEQDYTIAAGTPRETRVKAGTMVFACTASAMSDAGVTANPDAFDPDRPPFIRRLHFGHGHHACLGRFVAGEEIPEIVRRVLLRPGIRLLPGPDGKIDFGGGPFPERFVIAYDGSFAAAPRRRASAATGAR